MVSGEVGVVERMPCESSGLGGGQDDVQELLKEYRKPMRTTLRDHTTKGHDRPAGLAKLFIPTCYSGD